MIAYAIEDLIVWGVVKGVVAEKTKFFEAIILLVLAFILIFLVNDEYNKCLIIWVYGVSFVRVTKLQNV